jgi:hypothetical protein
MIMDGSPFEVLDGSEKQGDYAFYAAETRSGAPD